MKTTYAKELAAVFDQQSLEEIANWARTAKEMLRSRAKEMRKEGARLNECIDMMNDSDPFAMLAYYIDEILEKTSPPAIFTTERK